MLQTTDRRTGYDIKMTKNSSIHTLGTSEDDRQPSSQTNRGIGEIVRANLINEAHFGSGVRGQSP